MWPPAARGRWRAEPRPARCCRAEEGRRCVAFTQRDAWLLTSNSTGVQLMRGDGGLTGELAVTSEHPAVVLHVWLPDGHPRCA